MTPQKTSLAQAVASASGLQIIEVDRGETNLQCSCGGALVKFCQVVCRKPPPHHRKKRINKKWRKRWQKENYLFVAASIMLGRASGVYQCTQCGHKEGFYSGVCRNFVRAEPLPEGVLPLYPKETS